MLNSRTPKQIVGLAAAAVVGLGVITVAAEAAWAEPPGCSSSVRGGTNGAGLLEATASGSCGVPATRTLRVEIKQAISGEPDPLLAANTEYHTGTAYSVSVVSCDHGNKAYYYGRGFFTTNATYHDTATTLQQTC